MISERIHMATALYSGPSVEPLTYSEASSLLRLQDTTDQTYVTALIVAARRKVEEDTSRKLISQTWDVYLDRFPDGPIVLPFAPLSSVTSLKTTNTSGTQTTHAATVYQADTASVLPRIVEAPGESWPADDLRDYQGIAIRCVFGYGTASTSVPSDLIRAMEQLIFHWYGYRTSPGGAVLPRWFGYDALIAPYRVAGMA